MKKLLLSFLCLMALPTIVLAQEENPVVIVDDIRYSISLADQEAILTNGADASGDIVIPSEVEYEGVKYPVTTIGIGAFVSSGVSEVTCNEGLKRIEYAAFTNMGIRNIHFPSTLIYIGDNAFEFSSDLKSIVIPPSVTELGKSAFGHTGIEEIYFTGGVTELPQFVCSGCSKLKRVHLKGVEKIEKGAFSGCRFDSITIPETVIEIGKGAFAPETLDYPIKLVKCFAKIPPVLGQWVFGFDSSLMEVLVPASSLDLYRNDYEWSRFFLTGFDDASFVMPAAISAADHWTVYGLDGHLVLDTDNYGRVNSLTPGLYIINGKKQIIR